MDDVFNELWHLFVIVPLELVVSLEWGLIILLLYGYLAFFELREDLHHLLQLLLFLVDYFHE